MKRVMGFLSPLRRRQKAWSHPLWVPKQKLKNTFKKVARELLLWCLVFIVSLTSVFELIPVRQTSAASSALSSCGNIFYGDTTNAGIMRTRSFSASSGVCTSTWAAEINGITGSASNILHVSAKTAPTREEMMIGSLRVNGTLQIESCTTACNANADFTNRWSHASVSATQDCDTSPTAGACNKPFDIGYQALNGKAMIVYAGDGADGGTVVDADTVYYAEWDGSAWAPNTTPGTPGTSNDIDLPGTAGTPLWIRVIPAGDNLADDRSNRVMLLVGTDDTAIHAFYWDGSAWDSGTTIEATDEGCDVARCFDGNWQGNNTFIVSYGDNDGVNDIKYREYVVGTGWDSETQAYTTGSTTGWVSSVADPTSSRIYVTTSAQGNDTRGAVWRADNATDGWTVCASGGCPDTTIETVGGQQATGSFERFNGDAIHAYNNAGTTAGDSYMEYTQPSTWGATTTTGMTPADDPNAMLSWGNPNNDDVMMALVDIDCDIDTQQWNGTALDTATLNLEASSSFHNGSAGCAVGGTPVSGMASWAFDFAWKMYTPWQRNWRWFPGTDTASTPSTGTALAAENTAPTGITDGQDLRLRINYSEVGRSISNTDARKKLQYTSGCNPNTTLETDCTWTDVDNSGGAGIWRYVDLTCTLVDCADNVAIQGTVLTGSSTCAAGVGVGCGTWVLSKDSASVSAMDHTAQSGADTVQESEWQIEPNGAAGGTTYYFRIFNVEQSTPIYRTQYASNCGAGSAQCTYPSITTATVGPTTDQVMRHGNWFNSGVEQSFFWAN